MSNYCYLADPDDVYKLMTIIEERNESEEYILRPFHSKEIKEAIKGIV